MTRYGLADYPTSALSLSVAALVRAHRGRVDDARSDADAAGAALDGLTDVAAFYEAEVRVVLARTALKLSELNTARAQLAVATRLGRKPSEAVILQRWLREAGAEADVFADTAGRLTASLGRHGRS